jgi:hypothetical protein
MPGFTSTCRDNRGMLMIGARTLCLLHRQQATFCKSHEINGAVLLYYSLHRAPAQITLPNKPEPVAHAIDWFGFLSPASNSNAPAIHCQLHGSVIRLLLLSTPQLT